MQLPFRQVLLIELKPFDSEPPKGNPDDNWVKEHEAQFGAEPSFF